MHFLWIILGRLIFYFTTKREQKHILKFKPVGGIIKLLIDNDIFPKLLRLLRPLHILKQ